jgi:glycosyltransferase involved in cell wall biosynthesis
MIECLLIGPPQEGGEGVYVREIFQHPPDGVRYSLCQRFHAGTEHARCNVVQEVALNRMIRPFLRYGFGFRVLTLKDHVELVHVHSQPVKIRSRRRVPVVMSAGSSHYIHVRDYEGWSEQKIRRRYALATMLYGALGIHDELLRADDVARVYTFSNWAREIYLSRGFPKRKIDVIHPGFEVPPLVRGVRDDEAVRFLFVGRDFVRKGGPLVLEAFAALKRKLANVSLTVVTRDPIAVAEGVTVLPFGDRAVLYRDIYPRADVFVMPTEAEGWGFTNAEAMSFALPVISTAINAIPEIVHDGVSGILVPPRDGEALFAAMERLAASRSLREEMGAAAREQFVARFSVDVFRARLAEFYAEALKN